MRITYGKDRADLISSYLENKKLTPQDHEKVKDEVVPFMNNMEIYLNKKKLSYNLEKNLEYYSVRLLESNLVEGTSFYIDDNGVEFRAEGYIHQNIFMKTEELIDPISYYLRRVIIETTGQDAHLTRDFKGDNQVSLRFDFVENSDLFPNDLR